MLLEDLFLAPSFFCPSTTRPPYFYPSIFVFTCPNDGWTGLNIKLWYSVQIYFFPSHVLPGLSMSLLTQSSHVICLPLLLCPWCFYVPAMFANYPDDILPCVLSVSFNFSPRLLLRYFVFQCLSLDHSSFVYVLLLY